MLGSNHGQATIIYVKDIANLHLDQTSSVIKNALYRSV